MLEESVWSYGGKYSGAAVDTGGRYVGLGVVYGLGGVVGRGVENGRGVVTKVGVYETTLDPLVEVSTGGR